MAPAIIVGRRAEGEDALIVLARAELRRVGSLLPPLHGPVDDQVAAARPGLRLPGDGVDLASAEVRACVVR